MFSVKANSDPGRYLMRICIGIVKQINAEPKRRFYFHIVALSVTSPCFKGSLTFCAHSKTFKHAGVMNRQMLSPSDFSIPHLTCIL